MGLLNIFRNRYDSKLTPLTMDEKIFFVKVFLQKNDILPMDFGDVDGDELNSIAGTPQYTLVMYLDFLYTFMANGTIRNNHIDAAANSGIDLSNFGLSKDSFVKLAEYYTALRVLPSNVTEAIHEEWKNSLNNSDKDSFDSFRDASYWWGDNIVVPLQIYDSVEKKAQENITDDGYKDKVTHQLSLNRSLIDAYLEIRGIE